MLNALRTSVALIRVSRATAARVAVVAAADVAAEAAVNVPAVSAVAVASVPVLAAESVSVVVRVLVTARMLRSRARARRLIKVSVVLCPMRARLSLVPRVHVARAVRAAVRVAVSVAVLVPVRVLNKAR